MFVTPATLVDRIHKTPTKAVVIATGGGSGIFQTLTHRGGGSATLISGRIPYDEQETSEILGGIPEKTVSAVTARKLAMAAYEMALKRRTGSEPVIGLACTAALQKTPVERDGRGHYIYCALQTAFDTVCVEVHIHKAEKLTGSSTPEIIRVTEEKLTVDLLLNLLAEGCGLDAKISHLALKLTDVHGPGLNSFVTERATLSRENETISKYGIEALIKGHVQAIGFDCYESTDKKKVIEVAVFDTYSPQPRVIFPGSFNPYHEGHGAMAGYAVDRFGKDVDYEISICNVDKPTIDLISLNERLSQFCVDTGGHGAVRVWVTTAATFVQKAQLFPNSTFLIGYDTLERLVHPKYSGSVEQVAKKLTEFGSKFLVFGRITHGTFKDDVSAFPLELQSMLFPAYGFRQDISSTTLRK